MKKIMMGVVLFLMILCGTTRADIITKPFTFPTTATSTIILGSQVNSNWDTIYGDYNGNICAINIKDLCVGTADLANSAVTSGKIANQTITADDIATGTITGTQIANSTITAANLTGTMTTALHGDLSAAITTMHSASSVYLFDPADLFSTTTTNVEQALYDVAKYVAYASSTDSSAATQGQMFMVDYLYMGSTGTLHTLVATQTAGFRAITLTLSLHTEGSGAGCVGTITLNLPNLYDANFIDWNNTAGLKSHSSRTTYYNFAANSFTAGTAMAISIGFDGGCPTDEIAMTVYGVR